MTYNPITALLIFLGGVLLIFAFFRPVKGWYWLLKNNYQSNEKTVMEDILKQLLLHYTKLKKIIINSLLPKLPIDIINKNIIPYIF